MRPELFFNPLVLIERLALAARRHRRLRRLRGTPAQRLSLAHIDSLELLEFAAADGPRVIYDVGANVGTWSCLAKAIVPHARIDAFEPLACHHADFAEHTRTLRDIHLHRIALGATRTTMQLNVMDFSDASSFLPIRPEAMAEFNLKPAGSESLPVVPLDEYRAEHALPSPDLIKLDVQGFEIAVLQGAEECLRHARFVLSEVSFREYYEGQPLFHDVAAHLGARGYRLHAFAETTAVGRPIGQTDVLFVKA